jgi:hypothetical protein
LRLELSKHFRRSDGDHDGIDGDAHRPGSWLTVYSATLTRCGGRAVSSGWPESLSTKSNP